MIINIIEYERVAGNGRDNLYYDTHHVKRSHAAFAPLAAYVVQVMQASGLRRSPFHAEVMLTPRGPRLIEVGARLGGSHYAYMANDVHGGDFDIFDLAAHYYLHDTPYTGAAPDFDHYDRVSYLHVDGVSAHTETITRLAGLQQVESLPQFRRWVHRPQIGDKIRRTVDLLTVPYAFTLMGERSQEELRDVGRQARKMIAINGSPAPSNWMLAHARNGLQRSTRKGGWLLHHYLHLG